MKEADAERTRRPVPRGGMIFLAFILVAGPVAWLLDLFVKFVLASDACLDPSPSHGWLFEPSAFVVVDVLAFAITAIALAESYQSWNATSPSRISDFHAVTEIGESRQHFLALWGMLIGAMFLSAIVFSFVVNVAVSPCA